MSTPYRERGASPLAVAAKPDSQLPLLKCPACGSGWSGASVTNVSHDGPHGGCAIPTKHLHQACDRAACKTTWTAGLTFDESLHSQRRVVIVVGAGLSVALLLETIVRAVLRW